MHTPGPWKPTTTYGESTNEPFMVWCDGVDAAIAHVYNRSEMGSDSHATQRANARLIAASPDLYAALQDILLDMAANESNGLTVKSARHWASVQRARAAIAQATT